MTEEEMLERAKEAAIRGMVAAQERLAALPRTTRERVAARVEEVFGEGGRLSRTIMGPATAKGRVPFIVLTAEQFARFLETGEMPAQAA